MKLGRNEPCACGSGKKFKRCCGETGLRAAGGGKAAPFDAAETYWRYRRQIDHRPRTPRLLGDLLAVCQMFVEQLEERHEKGRLARFFDAFERYLSILDEMGLSKAEIADFVSCRVPFDLAADPLGRPPARIFFEDSRPNLPGDAVRALQALLAGEDAFARVEKPEKKTTFLKRLHDGRMLPSVTAFPKSGSIFLGRLVEISDHFCLLNAERVKGAAAEACVGLRDFLLSAESMLEEEAFPPHRTPAAALRLLALMARNPPPEEEEEEEEDWLQEEESVKSGSPVIVNADGHRTVLTTSSYEVLHLEGLLQEISEKKWGSDIQIETNAAGDLLRFEATLSRKPKGKRWVTDEVTVATLRADRKSLKAETNSLERDAELRRKLEKLPAGILRYRETEKRSIEEALARRRSEKPADRKRREREEDEALRLDPAFQAEAARITRGLSKRWCDTAVPALGNRRPRTLARSVVGQARVSTLLHKMEAAPTPEGFQGLDYDFIREELGIPARGSPSSPRGRPSR